ncbi:MAG: carbamoyl-phosphate synthase large subunit [Elusimicrobiota bacterium]
MPRRTDIRAILVIGSGPIVIGQACEFDYSGTQGIKALREEGYRVALVNSNPATIMTDPDLADATYIEPLTPEYVEAVIARERPQALLPTLGGQTALNLAVALSERGILRRYGVKLIGAGLSAIRAAEDRGVFRRLMKKIGMDVTRGVAVARPAQAQAAARSLGFPLIVRASFTLGGAGVSIARGPDDLAEKIRAAFAASPPARPIFLEESVLGWKEYELEVMRDAKDNFVVVCAIENVDPMGVHTGDSITVAPAQTLSDRQYQDMRDAARKIVSAVGIRAGGCNVQFAVDPETGRRVAIEINPRVSRSSALASKATGFPIAKIAAKIAVGYSLDELSNDAAGSASAAFEPALDYVVTKVPRFAADKFGEFDLGTSMKSVGEVMAVGRSFPESLQKALRGLESGRSGFEPLPAGSRAELVKSLRKPSSLRIWRIRAALDGGMSAETVSRLTGIDPWFTREMGKIARFDRELKRAKPNPGILRAAKRLGFSDIQIGSAWGRSEAWVRRRRWAWGVRPSFNLIDTCAGEFASRTPYFYSTYESAGDRGPSRSRRKIVVLGSGPNRIGQGVEFDYCCVQASSAVRAMGYESVMINCNPETVSTDYDASDALYFEPLALEDVLEVLHAERPMGVMVQFGGQTPLKLCRDLERAGARILGTSPDAIDAAENRLRFYRLLKSLKIPAPAGAAVNSVERALDAARRIGYPVMARPSYVLGGRAMEMIHDEAGLRDYARRTFLEERSGAPLFIDRFLSAAVEVDVDAVADGRDVLIAGIMEHIEEAGIHSGDSSCVLPPRSLGPDVVSAIAGHVRALAFALKVKGLINVQFAVKDGAAYVLEANPRASRTVPFASKAAGVPLASLAAAAAVGRRLRDIVPARLLGQTPPRPKFIAVKGCVFPFARFPGADSRLGPEMKSTGEVMGIADDFPEAFAKSQAAAGMALPTFGVVFLKVKDEDKAELLVVARKLKSLGFSLAAAARTREFLARNGIAARDSIRGSPASLVIDTASDQRGRADGLGVPLIGNIRAAAAAIDAIAALKKGLRPRPRPLQELHHGYGRSADARVNSR